MLIERAVVRQLSYRLKTPYRLSSGDLELFDPIVLELIDADGRSGWGECLIVPGYTEETVAGSWCAALELARRVQGKDCAQARAIVTGYASHFPGVASTAYAALDMLRADSPFKIDAPASVPLLAPCQEHEAAALRDEIESLLAEGFKTLKIKVGYQWQEDLDRLSLIQDCVAGRASLRLDANRGFNRTDGQEFARRLDPRGIELFEQPCAADDWEANAAVASVSNVPIMLDESIYNVLDVDRAAMIANVGFVKLKLKKIGSAEQLGKGLDRIVELGMTPVLGDGVSMEMGCWMEACIATRHIDNAGEMNGFLKVGTGLFENPLEFKNGAIHLPAGYWPQIDKKRLARHTSRIETY